MTCLRHSKTYPQTRLRRFWIGYFIFGILRDTVYYVLTFLCSPASLIAASPDKNVTGATIYYASDSQAMDPVRGADLPTIQRLVDDLVLSVTQRPSVPEAWASLVKPTDRVGIKVSTAGRSISGTHPAVVEAIARGLMAAGIPRERILVWDRNFGDLIAAGYKPTSPYYILRWVDPETGYDAQNMVSSPIVGKLIWGDSRFKKRQNTRLADLLFDREQLSSQSFYAKVLVREVDKIINVPSLTDSYLTGIQGALVNMTLPNLDNWRRFTKEPGNSYIAEVYADEVIRPKVVLTLLDGLVLQFAGGPYPDPTYTQIKNTLFVSFDPVAIDATAVRLIDELRTRNHLPKTVEMTTYVQSASQMGLGVSNENAIELKHVKPRRLE